MTAGVLSAALPYIQEYTDRTIVIKYGGHAMEDEAASLSFARDVVMLKQVRCRYGVPVQVGVTEICIGIIDRRYTPWST